jgi:site-specific DNA-methyltransferase (adenine-specific)
MNTGTIEQRHVEYAPLDALVTAVRNPKGHDLPGIEASIARFGYVSPSILDGRTHQLVAGNGRVLALRAMRDRGQAPPAGVRLADDGTWLVPVLNGWASRSDAEADAYLVADNEWTVRGGWDDEQLGAFLTGIADADPDLLAVTGFTADDLAALLGDDSREQARPLHGDPDDAPSLPANPVTVAGDAWQLGPHRLLCGDATDQAAVAAILAGDRCDVMWTDPPYGVDYVGKTKDELSIRNDGASGLPELLAGAFAVADAVLKPGASIYVAHAPGPLAIDSMRAFTAAGFLWRQNLVWVKDVLVLGHSDYHYRHEPIMYGFTDGGAGRLGRGGDRWFGDNSAASVFEVARPDRSGDHPTMKPVELIKPMLSNSCPPGGLVYDPFAGSGSAIIAAHILGLNAAAVEIDPAYCDVICRRYQHATGDLPILAATGETHDFEQDQCDP